MKILVTMPEKQNINGKPYFIFKAFLKSLRSNKNRKSWGVYKGKHTIKMTRKTSTSSDSVTWNGQLTIFFNIKSKCLWSNDLDKGPKDHRIGKG